MKAEPTIRVYRGENQFAYGNLGDDWQETHAKTLQHFIECIKTGKSPKISSRHAATTMKYTTAALQSAASGKRIRL